MSVGAPGLTLPSLSASFEVAHFPQSGVTPFPNHSPLSEMHENRDNKEGRKAGID
jgi:hypothetical protein